ncbi:neuronal pentraxin receptor a [Aplochiton taeniatus]
MVAFIGAVICIIAAVHTGSATAAAAPQQPLSENQSLFPDTVSHSQTSGSIARPRPLGALHGSETPKSEAPTFNIPSSLDEIPGLGGHDPSVNRLICTPIPAGECNSKNFQQQADDPSLYAGEDSGYLLTAAEELRLTVQQQKDQIVVYQRTIRELTGELSECEKAPDGRSSSERRVSAAGILGGSHGADEGNEKDRDLLMVRDSPVSSPDSDHLLTVQAVEELEQAISQLNERIEKLESDIGPVPHNQTRSTASRGQGGAGRPDGPAVGAEPRPNTGAKGPWTMEELEGELERKVALLEKERKALRREMQKHTQEMDQGISTLHRRLAGLEEGLSDQDFPQGHRLTFPSRTNYMYAELKHAFPELQAFTVCLWLRPTEGGIGTPLSYAVPGQPNEMVLLQGLHTPTELLVNDKVAQLPLNLSRGSWQHVCVSWSQNGGAWQAYQGGKLRGEGHGLAPWHHIRPGGVLILGQEQDTLGGGFDSSQALVGELSQVGLWDRALTPAQVSSLARCGAVEQGRVVHWTGRDLEVHGGARKEPGEPCSKHTRSPQ